MELITKTGQDLRGCIICAFFWDKDEDELDEENKLTSQR
jgi:hypothetical protein